MESMELKSNRLVFAGPFLGEFGWELSHWMPHVRWLRKQYKGRHLAVASFPGRHPLYQGIADEFWPLPDWFVREGYDLDCFESLVSASRFVQESTYGKLIDHFRGIYGKKFQDVIETRTPRGFNHVLRQSGHVLFEQLCPSAEAEKRCRNMISAAGGNPVVILFARAVERKMFLNINANLPAYVRDLKEPLPSRNWPAPYWEKLFGILYERFGNNVTFAIGGTRGGNCLLSAAKNYENVISLFDEDVSVSLDLTIAFLSRALCSISSQSGPTHLSVQCRCPSFVYGDQEHRHVYDDNPLRADVCFFRTANYADPPEVVAKDAAAYIEALLSERRPATVDLGDGPVEIASGPVESIDAVYVDGEPVDLEPKPSEPVKRIGMVGVFDVEGSSNIPFARALVNLGYDIDVFNYRTVAGQIGYPAMNKALCDDWVKSQPDALIFCKANGVTADTMAECSRHATTCWYMMDSVDHLNDPRFGDEYIRCANACDLSVVTTAAMREALLERGVTKPIFHVIQGVDPNEFPIVAGPDERPFDVTFIGAQTSRRASVLGAIESWGYSVNACGPGWSGGPVSGVRFSAACSKARVCLSMSNSDPGVDSFSDRTLRYLSAFGCVLVEYTQGLERYFENRKHLIWFKGMDDMKKQLETLLTIGQPARKKIARQGHEHFLANYTWHHAAEKIMGHLLEVRTNG